MNDRATFFRPAWPDEEPRAAELAGRELRMLIRAMTGSECRFYVLGRNHPVERLIGVVAWGERLNEPGGTCFGFHISCQTPEVAVSFLASFRRFVLEGCDRPDGKLHYARLIAREVPVYDLLVQAGFRPGLINESYEVTVARLTCRIDAMKQAFGHRLDPPPGMSIVPPDPSHLPDLQRLCSRLHRLMIPCTLTAAFKDPEGPLAGFTPALSGVYLEKGAVRGAILIQHGPESLDVRALVADPSARMPSSRICHWLLAHSVETVRPLDLPPVYRFSTDPATHPATLRVVARMSGRRLAIRYRMEASPAPATALAAVKK
ncbi:MAG TPA: hypothetical protein VNQ90_14590 [Chthoniobacteraceae bacterium]|nr:hypothetical protein [Chthoniobacteraceae bacterium]